MKPESIKRMPDDQDLWLCLCGNHIWKLGFYPSFLNGNERSAPDAPNLEGSAYCCANCGRIVDSRTLQVVGKAENGIRAI
jgi:hypothetical protein